MIRIAGALVLVAATVAHAQVYDDPETEEALRVLEGGDAPPPDDATEQTTEPTEAAPQAPPVRTRRPAGLALKPGRFAITLTIEASLAKGAVLEPTSLAPDVSYGVADRLTVSVVHSGFATTGFRGSAGGGLCVTGADRGCPKVYNNAGAEALVDLVRGDVAIAAVAGLHALSFDPLFLDVKLGAQAMARAGRVTATFFPSVLVGVTERDAGNKGTVFLPVSIGAQVTRPLFLALGGGVAFPLAEPGDAYTARLGVIARVRVARGAFLAGSLFLPKLAGGDAVMGTGADARVAQLWLTYAP